MTGGWPGDYLTVLTTDPVGLLPLDVSIMGLSGELHNHDVNPVGDYGIKVAFVLMRRDRCFLRSLRIGLVRTINRRS